MKPRNFAKKIIKILSDKKAEDIILIDVRRVFSPFVSYFVIATATSETHSRALIDEVTHRIKKEKRSLPSHIEGYSYGHWVLADYMDVVLHIFLPEERKHYAIENLLGDMPIYEEKGRIKNK